MWRYHRVLSPNDADQMANSVDPDQTALGLLVYFVNSRSEYYAKKKIL